MSFVSDLFSSTPTPKVEPTPTRDTAADANAAAEEERRRRQILGAGTQMLSGSSGVTSELTGTRTANG